MNLNDKSILYKTLKEIAKVKFIKFLMVFINLTYIYNKLNSEPRTQ